MTKTRSTRSKRIRSKSIRSKSARSKRIRSKRIRSKSIRSKSIRSKSARKTHTLVRGNNKINNKSRRRGKSVRHLFRGGVDAPLPPPPPPPLPDGDDNDNGSVSDGDDDDNGSVGDGDDTDDDEEDDRALLHAVLSQNARTLKALLVTESSRINDDVYTGIDFDRRYWTLLHLALINVDEFTYEDPSLEIVQILLNVKGLNVNKKDSKGKTPLMVAKGVEFVKLLLGHRDINVNERDKNGSTALWLLANLPGPDEWRPEEEEGDGAERGADTLEIAQLLIDAGADVNIRGADGTTPLEAAEKRGFTEYVEKFSKIKRRLPFAKALHSIKGINEDTAKMKVLQNEDLQREIRKWLG